MSPEFTFLAGLSVLVLYVWYVATDVTRRKRVLGTALSVLVLGICLQAAYPPSQKVNLGLDLQGGTSFLLRLVKTPGQAIDPHVVEKAIEVIRKRIDKFGVSEPLITPEGNDRILVQIPGLDQEKIEDARQQLQKVAQLELRLVHPQNNVLLPQIEAGTAPIPPGYEVRTSAGEEEGGPKDAEREAESKLLVRKTADIAGEDVKSGYPFYEPTQGGWGVGLELTSNGAKKFGKLTTDHVGDRFAILLDGKVQSAPRINEPIPNGRASITGHFTEKASRNLASVLENPLSVPVKIEEERSASSTLGAEAIKSGVLSGVGGLILVLAFTLIYYRLSGLIATICLMVNFAMLVGVMAMFNFVLTLPGIAGMILTIGLAVDANVLIFERLREELAHGKGLKPAVEGAYDKAFSVIFDANVTTLIMAAILFGYATGPVKGFAVVLTIGVITSVFSAMIVSRNLFDWAIRFGLEKIAMAQLIRPGTRINFLGRRRLWLGISTAVMVAGIAAFAHRGERNFGIDFKGGDLLVLDSKEPVTEAQVRAVVEGIGLGDVPIQKEREAGKTKEYIVIRSPIETSPKIFAQLQKAMPEAGFSKEREDRVGKLVGGELAKNSGIALGLGMLGILFFVSARFQVSFAVGAVVALLHDIVITLGLFALTGRELSLVMIGAILTIAGYSINDTIVVFDRIRERLRLGGKEPIQETMNAAINETLSRTLLTSGTTFVSVFCLYLFGGAVLNDFAFAIMAGIVVGTYSSIFIASTTALWWANRTGGSFLSEAERRDESSPAQA